MCQEQEAAGHIASTVRHEKTGKAAAQDPSLPRSCPWHTRGIDLPTYMMGLVASVNLI